MGSWVDEWEPGLKRQKQLMLGRRVGAGSKRMDLFKLFIQCKDLLTMCLNDKPQILLCTYFWSVSMWEHRSMLAAEVCSSMRIHWVTWVGHTHHSCFILPLLGQRYNSPTDNLGKSSQFQPSFTNLTNFHNPDQITLVYKPSITILTKFQDFEQIPNIWLNFSIFGALGRL